MLPVSFSIISDLVCAFVESVLAGHCCRFRWLKRWVSAADSGNFGTSRTSGIVVVSGEKIGCLVICPVVCSSVATKNERVAGEINHKFWSWVESLGSVSYIIASKKSRSTGSDEAESRRWKLKDVLRRSNSLGRETIYFLCPKRVDSFCKKG